MTQAQTTAEMIARLIDENCQIHGLQADYETAKIVARELDARQAQINALTRERDKARAEAKALAADNRELLEGAKAVLENLDFARAEAERLRPAADAWEAYDDYMMCPESDEAAKFPVWVAAHKAAKSAQVARAAKESQP